MDTKVHKALAAAFSVLAIAQLYLVVGLFNQTAATAESTYLSASMLRPVDMKSRTAVKNALYLKNRNADQRATMHRSAR